MLLERLVGDVEAFDELRSRDLSLRPFAAAVEQVGEQRLQDAEALRRDGPGRAVDVLGLVALLLLGDVGQLPLVSASDPLERLLDFRSQLGRVHGMGPTLLPQDPRREQRQARVLGHEDAVLDPAGVSVDTLDPPGRVAAELDASLAHDVADLPVRPPAVVVDVEVLRRAEVALAAGREPDVAPHPRDAERLAPLVLQVLADHVPDAVLGQEREGVDRPLALLVPADRPVVELDRPLLRDRRLELREATRHLGRVVGVAHVDPLGGVGRGRVEPRPAEGEVLEREPQRLGVGELALEQVEAGLERRELVVGQLELGEEVALGAERVELLAGELVTLRVERDAQPDQLRTIGVEAARERLVRHLRVALDVLLHVARGERPPLGHEEGDERELTDQLVGVV